MPAPSAQVIAQTERRRYARRSGAAARQPVQVLRVKPILPISDAEVLNTSVEGVAISTQVPLHPGDRLSFRIGSCAPPIIAEVLAVEPREGKAYRVRCRCVLGGFES